MAVVSRNLTCVVCPAGCSLTVTLVDDQIAEVTGHTCGRGKKYAESEVTHPVRMLTTTVAITGNEKYHMLPVKTSVPIARERLLEAMEQLRGFSVTVPVHTGDILIANFMENGCNLVACKTIE